MTSVKFVGTIWDTSYFVFVLYLHCYAYIVYTVYVLPLEEDHDWSRDNSRDMYYLLIIYKHVDVYYTHIGCLLEERFLDQKQVLCLRSHTLIQRLITHNYQSSHLDMKAVHGDLADLYMETWVSGHSMILPDYSVQFMEELGRFIAQQPLLYGDTRYNLRKIRQLWQHLLHAGRCMCLNKVANQNTEEK